MCPGEPLAGFDLGDDQMSTHRSTAIAAIIPCYNGEAFLSQAIDSALAQQRPVSRVVVVDDGSTDSSIAIVEEYMSRGLPVESLRLPRNSGPGAARNMALRRIEEPFAAFLDADDVWMPNHCAVVASLLDRFPDAVLAYGDHRSLDGSAGRQPPSRPAGEPFDALVTLFGVNIVQQSAAIVRRDAVLAAGGYLPQMRHAEDFDLWLRLSALGPFVGSGIVSCFRREHENQVSRQASRMYEGAWSARRRAYERLQREAPDGRLLAKVDVALADALVFDYEEAWHSRDGRLVRFLLDSADDVDLPLLRAKHRQLTRRFQFYWPVWRAAAAVWDALRRGRAPAGRSRKQQDRAWHGNARQSGLPIDTGFADSASSSRPS
jgi:glycosyltransferase involved in cell wall biosynthesis